MSKVSYYFPHPQPLSPTTDAEPKLVNGKTIWVSKSRGVVRGVGTTQSVYYLWFEYLKRSEKYKKACKNKGKGMKKLYNDFGNIFQYKTDANGFTDAKDFYNKWWEKGDRGRKLFGIRGVDELKEFATYEDVMSLKGDIDNYEIVVLPKRMPKTIMRKRVGQLVSKLESKDVDKGKARYEVKSERVDVESLRTCLEVYDLMITQKHTAVEVYAMVFGMSKEDRRFVFTDSRTERGMLRDYVCDYDKLTKQQIDDEMLQSKATTYADKKLKWRAKQRVKSNYDDGKGDVFDDTRKLTDEELEQLHELYYGQYLKILVKSPQSEERAKVKNYYKSHILRLYRKAKANVEAVENEYFGEGH